MSLTLTLHVTIPTDFGISLATGKPDLLQQIPKSGIITQELPYLPSSLPWMDLFEDLQKNQNAWIIFTWTVFTTRVVVLVTPLLLRK